MNVTRKVYKEAIPDGVYLKLLRLLVKKVIAEERASKVKARHNKSIAR